jgi:hypothetical protein
MGSKPCKKLARFPDHRNLKICRNRKVTLICRNSKVASICSNRKGVSSQPSQNGASSFPSGARSQTACQRPRKAHQSLFTGARRPALLQRCVLALSTFYQSPHESNHVDVSPAKGFQNVVLTPTTPTTSFVVISDRVGTSPPAEGGNVQGTLLRGVNGTFSCSGGVLINNVVHLYLLLSYHYFTSLYFILFIFILLSLKYIWTRNIILSVNYLSIKYISVLYISN